METGDLKDGLRAAQDGDPTLLALLLAREWRTDAEWTTETLLAAQSREIERLTAELADAREQLTTIRRRVRWLFGADGRDPSEPKW